MGPIAVGMEHDKHGPAGKIFRKGFPARLVYTGCIALSAVTFIGWLAFVTPWLQNHGSLILPVHTKEVTASEGKMPSAKELKANIVQLEKKLERLTPGGAYLVVNTSDNEFFLYKSGKQVRNGLCSTGSMIRLQVNDEKHYQFKTPKGVFPIRGKIVNPVWRKPDWAFLEEGLPVPSANDPSRYERGVLGDYALSLGDGYLIHGTLYKRFLGMPVTHGCIRMNDEDLETVYQTLPVGAKVFIY